jgi:hypothetical protein
MEQKKWTCGRVKRISLIRSIRAASSAFPFDSHIAAQADPHDVDNGLVIRDDSSVIAYDQG